MGNFFGGKTKTTEAPFENSPWLPQQPFLKEGFEAAKDALGTVQNNYANIGKYPGLNDTQKGALSGLATAGTNFSSSVSPVTGALIQSAVGGPQVASNPELDRLSAAGSAALSGKGSFADSIYKTAMQPGQGGVLATKNYENAGPSFSKAGEIFGDVSSDANDTIVGNAGKYVNNDILQGQIDAASRDVVRNFERTQGGIKSAAVGANASNSSRVGTLEALASRDAQDRVADIAAGMRGDALETGINTAAQAEQMRRSGTLSAGGLLQNDDALLQSGRLAATDQVIGNSNDRLSLALGAEGARQGNVNAGLGALSDAAAGRAGATNDAQARFNDTIANIGASYGMSSQGLLDALASGDRFQQQDIADMASKLEQAGIPLELVQQYMATVGGNYGSKGYQTEVTQEPSIFQQLVGGAATGLGAWGSFRK